MFTYEGTHVIRRQRARFRSGVCFSTAHLPSRICAAEWATFQMPYPNHPSPLVKAMYTGRNRSSVCFRLFLASVVHSLAYVYYVWVGIIRGSSARYCLLLVWPQQLVQIFDNLLRPNVLHLRLPHFPCLFRKLLVRYHSCANNGDCACGSKCSLMCFGAFRDSFVRAGVWQTIPMSGMTQRKSRYSRGNSPPCALGRRNIGWSPGRWYVTSPCQRRRPSVTARAPSDFRLTKSVLADMADLPEATYPSSPHRL
jgi:hypothetical protein